MDSGCESKGLLSLVMLVRFKMRTHRCVFVWSSFLESLHVQNFVTRIAIEMHNDFGKQDSIHRGAAYSDSPWIHVKFGKHCAFR